MNVSAKSKILSYILILTALLSVVVAGCGSKTQTHFSKSERYDYVASIMWDGLERTYIVHVGQSYDGTRPTPLVIALHGDGGTGSGTSRLTGFDSIADREGFIVVYPEGIEGHWNDGRVIPGERSSREDIDDVGFISALIDELAVGLRIDSKRVFVTGISNGAMMTHRLASELSTKIAAVAAVAGNLPANMAPVWAPTRPVSAMIINGTADPLVPWAGGTIGAGLATRGKVLSVADTVEFWVKKDGCSATAAVTELPDKDPADGTTVKAEVYTAKNGTQVILLTMRGGGHTWPGGPQYLPASVIGPTCRDINASEEIWRFFTKHPLK